MRWKILVMLLLLPRFGEAYRRTEVEEAPGRYLALAERSAEVGFNAELAGLAEQDVLGALKRALFSWSAPSCTDLMLLPQGASSVSESNLTRGAGAIDGQHLVVWRDRWPPPGALEGAVTSQMPAVTTVVYDVPTGTILDADIDINGQDFSWTASDDGPGTDLQNILTHELGHLIGLDHSDDPGATMYLSTHVGERTKRTLEADDLLGLCTIYPYGVETPAGAGEGHPPAGEGGCQLGAEVSGIQPAALIVLLLAMLALRKRQQRRGRG